MRKTLTCAAIGLIATLTACSHGSNDGTLPAKQTLSTGNSVQQKQLREEQPIPSSFVAPKHAGYLPETPSLEQFATGIQEAGQAPVPGGMFDIVNQYNTMEGGDHVTVYAGSLTSTGQGVLLVVRRSMDLHTAQAHTYTVAPTAVRIVSAADGELQLQTLGAARENVPFRLPL